MSTALPILVLNGPNLNLLGTRQPEVYGHDTLADALELAAEAGAKFGREVVSFQSNSEGALIDKLHQARGQVSGIAVNAGGLSHTSIALPDALVITEVPVVEVHVTNVYAREEFRRHSHISVIARAVVAGMGIYGYAAAVEYLVRQT